jgi:hypothetical protein
VANVAEPQVNAPATNWESGRGSDANNSFTLLRFDLPCSRPLLVVNATR